MLTDHHVTTPRHPDFVVGLSAYSEITPGDVAFRLAEIAQEEAAHRRRARRRAWAAIRRWLQKTARDPLGPTTPMATRSGA